MTTLTLTPTGQQLTVPTSWADVTLEQFLLLDGCADLEDKRTVPELLLGLEAGGLNQLAAQDAIYIANLVAFTLDKSDVYALLPPPGLPEPGTLPYGCLALVQMALAAEPDRPDLYHAPFVLSVYRTQMLWGKVEEGRRAACEAAVRASPVTEVLAEALAFCGRSRKLLSATSPMKQTTASRPMKKSRQILTRLFRKDSAPPSPSTP